MMNKNANTNTHTSSQILDSKNVESLALFTIIQGAERVCLQDLGRKQSSQFGVSASGAADEYALLQANHLIGNKPEEAVLELLLDNVEIAIHRPCQLIVTGVNTADSAPSKPALTLNQETKSFWQVLTAQAGDVLSIAPLKAGNYAYLSVVGGFQHDTWFNSAVAKPPAKSNNTKLTSPITEYFAKATSHVDATSATTTTNPHESEEIQLAKVQLTTKLVATKEVVKNQTSYNTFYSTANREQTFVARFIANAQWQQLSAEYQTLLLAQTFSIDTNSNKMGYRVNLQSPSNTATSAYQTLANLSGNISKPVVYGQIQLPGAEQWIVLMKDRQTIGGYPTIGTVMKTDLFRLAQLKPGQKLRFLPISLAQAQAQLSAFYQRFGVDNR